MPTSQDIIDKLVQRFIELVDRSAPIEPVAALAPDLTVEEAYRVQKAIVDKLVARGDKIVGKKAAATSKALQTSLGLSEPAYGHLFQSQQVADAGTIPITELIRPVVECEITFRLSRSLTGPNITADNVKAASESVVASLEIVDFRSPTLKPSMLELLSYNAFAARFVLGTTPVPVANLDLVNLAVTLTKNGQQVASSTGAAVMGNPAASVAWLANKVAQHNAELKPGEIILSGTLTPPEPVQVGDHFEAFFEKIGSVSVRFT